MPILSRSLSFSFLLSFFSFSPALGLLLPRGPSGQGSVSSSGSYGEGFLLLRLGRECYGAGPGSPAFSDFLLGSARDEQHVCSIPRLLPGSAPAPMGKVDRVTPCLPHRVH